MMTVQQTEVRPQAVVTARRKKWRLKGTRTLLALVALIVFLAPFLWMVIMSVRPALDAFELTLWFTPTLEAYRALIAGNFLQPFANSLMVSVISTVFSLLLGVPAAWVLTRWRFRARRYVAQWILVTRMAPPIAFTIPFFLAWRWLGLQDTIAGLAIVYLTFNLAIVIWLMQTFFSAIPVALEEAAWMDGCPLWRSFWHISLPLVKPGLAATAILCFIFSWNDFFFALILTRTNAITAPVAIVNFLQYEGWEWSKIAASGTLVMLPVVAFTLLVRRYLVHGLTAGGIKD